MDKTTQLTIAFCELSEYPHIWEKDQTEKKMEECQVVGEEAICYVASRKRLYTGEKNASCLISQVNKCLGI